MSDAEVVWALFLAPSDVMRMRLDRIADFQQEGPRVAITERDPDYARELHDTDNPQGETDFVFQLPDTSDGHGLARFLNLALLRHAPVFEKKRAHVAELKLRQGVPIESWDDCPSCRASLSSKTAGAAGCKICGLCFSDPNLEPVVSDQPGSYGEVTGTKPWRPLLETQLPMKDRTNEWVYRPRDAPAIGPFVMPSTEALELFDEFP